MAFIYHMVPKNMIGNRLIPLNQMKTQNLDLFNREVSKYLGREKILQRFVPKLNCLWNDVLHFSAISPEIIFRRFEELGFGNYNGLKWFEIPITHFNNLASVIYRAPQVPRPDFALADEDVEFLNVETYQEPLKLSEEAEKYFVGCKKEGKVPLPFQFTPHILLRGEIETTNLKVTTR